MLTEIDPHNLPPFPKRIPEKLKTIREHLGLTPDEIARKVGAKTSAEILAYENDEDDLLVSVLFGYAKLAEIPVETIVDDARDLAFGIDKTNNQGHMIMNEDTALESPGKGGIDPAALAVASLAAAVSVMAPPGPYAPGSILIGATILLFIFAYDKEPDRNPFQRLAFSAVCALITILMFGYPLELLATGLASLLSPEGTDVSQSRFVTRFRVLFYEMDYEKDIKYSRVPPLLVISLWIGLTATYLHRYSRLKSKIFNHVNRILKINNVSAPNPQQKENR